MFSIVMPLWNKAPTVKRAIESVLAQEFQDFELIVVDDGSTDGGEQAVAAIGDPRLRLLRQANAGAGHARNAGIAAAAADWIAFIDADDIWLPDHLSELDRVRRAHPKAGLIGTAYLYSGPDGAHAAPGDAPGRIGEIAYFEAVGMGGRPLWTSSAAIPREVYDRLGGFRPDPLSQDSEYWARIALALPVAVSSRPTAIYVQGTGGLMDGARTRWRGRRLRSAADISATVAFVLERYEAVASAAQRHGMDLFIDRNIEWCLHISMTLGDLETARTLRPFFRLPPSRGRRLVLAIARLPAPLAWVAYRAGRGLKALGRASRGR